MSTPSPRFFSDAERLEAILSDFELSQADLAKAVSTSPPFINGILKGRKKIGKRLAERLSAVFGLDAAWLLSGQGPPLYRPEIVIQYRADKNAKTRLEIEGPYFPSDILLRPVELPSPEEESTTTTPGPPLFDEEAAGERFFRLPVLRDLGDVTKAEIDPEGIEGHCVIPRGKYICPERLRCVRMPDESMFPALPVGSVIAIDPFIKDRADVEGKIVCARGRQGEIVIRYWYDRGQYVLLTPANPACHPEPLSRAQAETAVIGMVVWASLNLAPKRPPTLEQKEQEAGA